MKRAENAPGDQPRQTSDHGADPRENRKIDIEELRGPKDRRRYKHLTQIMSDGPGQRGAKDSKLRALSDQKKSSQRKHRCKTDQNSTKKTGPLQNGILQKKDGEAPDRND